MPAANDNVLHAYLTSRFRGAGPQHPPLAVAEIMRRITALLEGEHVDFDDVDLDLTQASDFERQVWNATRQIRCGEIRSYGELATAIGAPGAARAVGTALGHNPIPIIIPCHRVLGATGRAGGFSAPGGTATKFKILEIEGARRGAESMLFDHLPLAVKPSAS